MAGPLATDDTKPNTVNDLAWKVINVLSSIFIFLTLTATMWSMSQINEISKEVASIQASRFTVQDGVKMATAMSEMQQKYSDIIIDVMNRVDIIDERTKQNPPTWVIDDLKELKEESKVQQEHLAELSSRISSLEAYLKSSKK